MQEAATPGRWAQDPGDPTRWRWWTGTAWSEHTAPRRLGPAGCSPGGALPERTPEALGPVIAARASGPPARWWGRPWGRAAGWCTTLTGLAVMGLLVGGRAGTVPVASALLPAALLLLAAVTLTRYSRLGRESGTLAFLWGAGAAAGIAVLVNETVLAAHGSFALTAVLVAPLVEEAGKAVPLGLLRRTIHGPAHALGVAVLAAAGFAVCEDVVYFAAAAPRGPGVLVATVLARGVFSPFAHPVFTAATAVGLVLAQRARSRPGRIAWRAGGFGLAVALHAGWNLTALTGHLALLALPIVLGFLGIAALAERAVRRELGGILHLPAVPVAPDTAASEVSAATGSDGVSVGGADSRFDRDEQLVLATVGWRRRAKRELSRATRRRFVARAGTVLELALVDRRLARPLPAGLATTLAARRSALADSVLVAPSPWGPDEDPLEECLAMDPGAPGSLGVAAPWAAR